MHQFTAITIQNTSQDELICRWRRDKKKANNRRQLRDARSRREYVKGKKKPKQKTIITATKWWKNVPQIEIFLAKF